MGKMNIIRLERIERGILLIRGHRVMLDTDLAAIYGVPTKSLNLAVRRNIERFPADFMFRLRPAEWEDLRLQIETSRRHGGRRYLPYAFTEHGVAMLSSVVRSKRAIAVNIEIVRVFVRLRQLLATHTDLARRLDELQHKYDGQFAAVFEAIRALMDESVEESNEPRIGYDTEKKEGR